MGLRQALQSIDDENKLKAQAAAQAAEAKMPTWNGSAVQAAGAAPAPAAAPGLAGGLSAAGTLAPGPVGTALTGAGAGASLGTLVGGAAVGGPVGAGIGAGLALIQGLLGSAAKRRQARAKAESDRQTNKGSIIQNAADSRSRTLRSLL